MFHLPGFYLMKSSVHRVTYKIAMLKTRTGLRQGSFAKAVHYTHEKQNRGLPKLVLGFFETQAEGNPNFM